MKFLEENSKTR